MDSSSASVGTAGFSSSSMPWPTQQPRCSRPFVSLSSWRGNRRFSPHGDPAKALLGKLLVLTAARILLMARLSWRQLPGQAAASYPARCMAVPARRLDSAFGSYPLKAARILRMAWLCLSDGYSLAKPPPRFRLDAWQCRLDAWTLRLGVIL
jgi:hypothetical protein